MIYTGNVTAGATDGTPVSESGIMSSPVSAQIAAGSSEIVICAIRDTQARTVEVTGGSGIEVSADGANFSERINLNIGVANTLFYVRLTVPAGTAPGTYAGALEVAYDDGTQTV